MFTEDRIEFTVFGASTTCVYMYQPGCDEHTTARTTTSDFANITIDITLLPKTHTTYRKTFEAVTYSVIIGRKSNRQNQQRSTTEMLGLNNDVTSEMSERLRQREPNCREHVCTFIWS